MPIINLVNIILAALFGVLTALLVDVPGPAHLGLGIFVYDLQRTKGTRDIPNILPFLEWGFFLIGGAVVATVCTIGFFLSLGAIGTQVRGPARYGALVAVAGFLILTLTAMLVWYAPFRPTEAW